VAVCRMILRHPDGRTEETEVRGDGPIAPGAFFKLGANSDQWWKVVRVRWLAASQDGLDGEAELEPTELPPHLAALERES
jgi:hypothetical protein